METKFWAGDYYLAYYEPEENMKSDLVFGYQLDGDWMAKYHGLPPVFPPDRADITLKKIKQTCIAINRYGAANFAKPTASAANPADFAAGAWVMERTVISHLKCICWAPPICTQDDKARVPRSYAAALKEFRSNTATPGHSQML